MGLYKPPPAELALSFLVGSLPRISAAACSGMYYSSVLLTKFETRYSIARVAATDVI